MFICTLFRFKHFPSSSSSSSYYYYYIIMIGHGIQSTTTTDGFLEVAKADFKGCDIGDAAPEVVQLIPNCFLTMARKKSARFQSF